MNKLAVTLTVISLLFLQGCKDDEEAVKIQIKAVKTIVMEGSNGASTRTLSGVVKTANQSDLSFRVSGRLISVEVKRGDTVKKGQVLAKLEQKDYVLAIDSAKAKLQSSNAELVTTKQNNTRQQNLLKQKFVSKAAAEKAAASYQEALSKVAVAKTDLQNAEDNLTRTTLRAPFDGKIAEKKVDNFAEVQAGSVAFVVQGDEGLEVDILVPETIIQQINHGGTALVSFPTLKNVNIKAIVTEIGARSGAGNAFPVTLKLAASKADIRPGLTAEVALRVKTANSGDVAFLIPTSAVDMRFFGGKDGSDKNARHVLVVDPETSTLKMVVILITDVEGNMLKVTSGLNAGDRVVVAGVPFLSKGQKVKLWKPQYSIPATLN